MLTLRPVALLAILTAACAACSSDPEDPAGNGAGGAGGGAGAGGGSAAAGWETLAPLAGGPRQETAVVALDGRILVLGGFNEGGQVVADVEIYDPATDAWTIGTPLPEPLHHANAAVHDGKLYVVGALRGPNFLATGKVHELDPATAAWTEKTPMPPGTERGSSAVGVIGTKIYVAGGFRALDAVADVSAYDVATDTWEALPALPAPRDHLVGGVVGGVLYAIGGRSGGIEGISGDVNAFDPEAGAWSPRAPMLTPRGGAAAGLVRGRFLVAGGEGDPSAPTGVFDENEVYDPAADAWSALEPMKNPRHGTGAVGVGDRLYVPGGADKQGFGAVDTNEAFFYPE